MKQFLSRGQVSLAASIVTGGAMVIASGFAAWATASKTISDTQTKVDVITEREQNHYDEVQRELTSIDGKLDALIKQRNTAISTIGVPNPLP